MMSAPYPDTATSMTPAEYRRWRTTYHPDSPRPRQGASTRIVPSNAAILCGVGRLLTIHYYGGRYTIEPTT